MEFLMAINLTPEQTEILKSQGVTKEQMQGDIDKFRKQGQTDEEIQASLDSRLQELSKSDGKQVYPEMSAEEMDRIANSPETLHGEVNYYNPEQTQKHKWWHPLLNVLPIGGAILGGIAGLPAAPATGGLSSVGLAGIGAAGGEGWKQTIEELTGQRNKGDLGEIAKQGAFGMAGEGVGQGAGKVFEALQPKIAETMAHIPKKDYLRVLQSLKSGNKIFDNKFTTKEAGQAIKKAVNEAEENVALRYSPIKEQIKDVIKSYGHNINPAEEEATPAINKLNEWLEKSNTASSGADNKAVEMRKALEGMGIKDINNPALQATGADGLSFKDTHLAKRALQKQSGDYDKYRGDSSELIKKLASTLNKNLREASPNYAKANSRFQDVEAEEMFNASSPRYLMHLAGRNTGRMLAGAHNPAVLPTELGFMAQMSPRVQKLLLQLHGLSTNAKLGGGIGSALYGTASPEQRAYEEAIRKKITPDGSIPAQQYRQERIK